MSISLPLLAFLCFVVWLLKRPQPQKIPRYDTCHTFQTRDGWRLHLYHYKLEQPTKRTPILLLHGMGGSPFQWELDRKTSWVALLHEAGYDVWSAELRGAGQSTPQHQDRKHGWGWAIETHIEEDLPAIIDAFFHVSKSDRLHCIGHGLGGACMALHLSQHPEPRVKTLTTLGVGLTHTTSVPFLSTILKYWFWPVFSAKPLFSLGSLLKFWTYPRWLRLFSTQPQHLTSQHIHPLSTPAIKQWHLWLQQGSWTHHDITLQSQLAQLQTPTLLITGAKDPITPPKSVDSLQKHMTMSNTKQIILGKKHGHTADYAHHDLFLSSHIKRDLIPSLTQWLQDIPRTKRNP